MNEVEWSEINDMITNIQGLIQVCFLPLDA